MTQNKSFHSHIFQNCFYFGLMHSAGAHLMCCQNLASPTVECLSSHPLLVTYYNISSLVLDYIYIYIYVMVIRRAFDQGFYFK